MSNSTHDTRPLDWMTAAQEHHRWHDLEEGYKMGVYLCLGQQIHEIPNDFNTHKRIEKIFFKY